MFCPECGQKNAAENRFCQSCGSEMVASGAAPTPPAGVKDFAAPAPPSPTPAAFPTPPPAPPASPPAYGVPPQQLPPQGGTPGAPTVQHMPQYAPPPSPPSAHFGPQPTTQVPPFAPPPGPSAPPQFSTPPPQFGPPPHQFGTPPPVAGFPPGFNMPSRPPQQPKNPMQNMLLVVVALIIGLLMWRSSHPGSNGASPSPSPTVAATTTSPPPPITAPPPGTPPSTTAPTGTTAVVITQAVSCRNVDGDGKPLEVANNFPLDATFYCSALALHLSKGSRLQGVCQGPGDYARTGTVDSDKVGDYYIWFKFTPPSGHWTPGRYTIDLMADGTRQTTLSLIAGSVDAAAPVSGPSLGIARVVMCRRLDKDYNPIDTATTFRKFEKVYSSVHVTSELGVGHEVTAKWYHGSVFHNEASITTKSSGERNLYFSDKPGRGGWEPGTWSMELYVDQKLANRVSYTVLP